MGRIKNMLGFTTEYASVVGYVGLSQDKKAVWKCLCVCGNSFNTIGKHLRTGEVVSCGCKRAAVLKNQGVKNRKHGDAGKTDTRLYRIWHGMKKRCNGRNTKGSKNYGCKGITYCIDWEEYERFKEWALGNGYADDLTLDRVDCRGNYEPKNCRWVDMVTQANNRSNTVYVQYNGVLMPRAILAKKLGMSNQAIFYRQRHNIPLDAEKKSTQIFVKEVDL